MARKLVLSVALAGLVVACGGVAKNTPPASPDPGAADDPSSSSARVGRDLLDRRVGDVAVYRFSGSYRSEPITVTEEIKAREAQQFVVDYTVATGDSSARYRVRRTVTGFEITAVSRLEGDEELPVERAEFDAWMEQTTFAADANVGRLSREDRTCLVGEDAHDCSVASYRVLVGDEPATLTVSTTADLPGRDVSGVIESDGAVLYRAELVELQRGGIAATARAER
jgi:hypothetical protein